MNAAVQCLTSIEEKVSIQEMTLHPQSQEMSQVYSYAAK